MPEIYVDADACPVREEVLRVAGRHRVKVWLVANGWLRVPRAPLVELVVVGEGLDVADRWIVERIGPGDVVVTADVPLAHECIAKGARALAPDGRPFTEASIGELRATRDLMTALREAGEVQGGGRPFGKRERQRFLVTLENVLQAIRRRGR